MAQKSPVLSKLGFTFYCIAIIAEILIILASAWPDMEAIVYGFIRYTNKPLPSLSCPPLMTTLDREVISIRLNNPLDKPITREVEAQFSSPLNLVTIRERVELQPGETKKLSWEVGEENIDLDYFIFGRVFAFPVSSLEMRESNCGTLVLDLPFTGGPVIFYTMVVIAISGLALGFWLYLRNSDMSDPVVTSRTTRMRFIASVMSVGTVASILSLWFVGVIALAITVIALSAFLIPHKN